MQPVKKPLYETNYWADFWYQRLREVAPAVLARVDWNHIPLLDEETLHANVKEEALCA